MARRSRPQTVDTDALIAEVRARFSQSPLSQIGTLLARSVEDVSSAVGTGSATPVQLQDTAAFVRHIMSRIPSSIGSRFVFDAAMVQSIARQWKNAGARMSGFAVPRYSGDWGYEMLPMPSGDRTQIHTVAIVHFPGADAVDAVDLLDYPWLLHELGHDLLYRNGGKVKFREEFDQTLRGVLDRLRVRSVADSGRAGGIARAKLDKIAELWTPTDNHRNWAHELAIDIIALWAAGPAYIECFCDVVDQPEINPTQVTPVHPPYEIRAKGLVFGALALGWGAYIQRLRDVLERSTGSIRDNFATASANEEIISGCVNSAINICNVLSLPRFRETMIDQVRADISSGADLEPGAELIVAAWLVHREEGSDRSSEWERRIVQKICEDLDITQ